jgi:hypothetical protein
LKASSTEDEAGCNRTGLACVRFRPFSRDSETLGLTAFSAARDLQLWTAEGNAVMREAAKNKVYGAVRSCLDRCIGAANPLVKATDYINRLRHDEHWSRQEADEVESLVFRAVRVIVRQPRTGCCHDTPSDN